MAYDAPTPEQLKAYYPAFASVADQTVQLYLDRAASSDVDQTWREADYASAIMAAAAHKMVRAGVSFGGGVAGDLPAGLTSFKSGSFSVGFSDEAVKAQVAGGWGSTTYGQDYAALLRTNKGGPRVAAGPAGVGCCSGFNGFAGPINSPSGC